MDIYQESKWLALEKALLDDETGGPVVLPFLFLEAITQNFSDEQLIGRGGFGAVYKGQLRNGKVVAVKKLHNRIEILEENFQREVACLIQAKHKNIVRFLGYCYETRHIMKPYKGRFVWADERQMLFCFEYLSKGNLSNHLTEPSTGLQWKVRYQIIRGICEGVGYLHQQRIVHMDLKPQNILLDDSMVPKIVDFGLSRRLSESQSRTITEHIVGTLGYMAPEFVRSKTITFKADIYSLGVIIMEILTGCKECPNVDKVLRSWTNASVKSECHPRLLEQVKVCADIGINCMGDNPVNRPAIEDIIHIVLDETDHSISSRDSREFIPNPANGSVLWRFFREKLLTNLNAGLWMKRLASLYSSVRSVSSTSSTGQLMDELETTSVFSAEEQSVFDMFYQYYRLAKKACKPIRITTEPRPYWLSESALLDVHPLELYFPFEAKKATQCSLNLINRTDRYFTYFITPQLPDVYTIKLPASYGLDPMSTLVLNVEMVQQELLPLDSGMFEILMISMKSKSDLQNLESSIGKDPRKIDNELLERVEEMDGEVYAAMLTAVVCPPRDVAPKVISRFDFVDIQTIDVHSTQPWILVGHFNFLSIWYYEMEATPVVSANIKGGELYGLAYATSVRFIPRTQWCVAGDDRGYIHVYTCLTTMDEIKSFKATGGGSVRSLAIHPTYPYLLSACKDDGVIEIWDWEKDWACSRKVETGFGMTRATFNPMDANTFFTYRLFDRFIKVWSINPSAHQPIIYIECPDLLYHDYVFTAAAGRNHVLVLNNSTGPQIWDLQTGTRVHTLSKLPRGYITAAACHPTLSLIAVGGDVASFYDDDDPHPAVSFWNSTNYRLEKTVWCTSSESIRYLGFVGSRRLVIGTTGGIEVLEIDMESLACQQ